MSTPTPESRPNTAKHPTTQQHASNSDVFMRSTVEELSRAVAKDATQPKAVVLMPPEEKLQVKLVKLDDVLRLQESKSDENLGAGAFWAFVGALLGIAVNIVTGEASTVSRASWVAIGAILLCLTMTGLVWLRFHIRARAADRRLSSDLIHG